MKPGLVRPPIWICHRLPFHAMALASQMGFDQPCDPEEHPPSKQLLEQRAVRPAPVLGSP